MQWVAYFNGGDAVHYMPRASYGSPQSLGCIELPYAAAEQAWGYLTLRDARHRPALDVAAHRAGT